MNFLKNFEQKIVTELQAKGAAFLKDALLHKTDEFFGVLRRVCPILQVPDGPVILTRFDDVREALDRPEIFSVRLYQSKMDPTLGPFMLSRDGAVENERDKGIMRAIMRRDDLPRIREIVGRLTKQAIAEGVDRSKGGALEVVSKVSRKVPIQLIGEYFGFPGPDLETMMRWSKTTQHDMFHNMDDDAAIHEKNVQSGREMRAYMTEHLAGRRKELESNPSAEDIAARLLRMRLPQEIGFDEERIQTHVMGALVGGVETTSAAIVQLLSQLLDRPRALEGARKAAQEGNDPLLLQYCWEALRFDPINPFVFRYCEKDYRIASGSLRATKVKAGTTVIVGTRSAMHDSDEIPDSDEFRLDRPPYHYFHVGYGMHTCLGDHISRVQIPEVIKQLLLQPGLRRAPGNAGKIYNPVDAFPESFTVLI